MNLQKNSQMPPTPLDQKTMLSLGATQLRPLNIIFSPFILLGLYALYSITLNPHSVFTPTGLIVGALSGSSICFYFTRRDLHLIAKKGEIRKSRKLRVLTALSLNYPWLIFVILAFFSLSAKTELLYLDFTLAFTLAHLLSLGILYIITNIIWENLNKKRIYAGRHGELYTIPKEKSAASTGNKLKRWILDYIY